MSNVFIKPCLIDGRPAIVRDPRSLVALAAAGEWKPRDSFWECRLRDGDVVEAEPDTSTEPPAPAPRRNKGAAAS